MQLKIKRSQKTTNFTGAAVFCIDARVEFTKEEATAIDHYKLGKQVLYSSDAAQNAAASAAQHANADSGDWRYLGHLAKSIGYGILAGMNLVIDVHSLQKGKRIECKSLEEVVGVESALVGACQNLKAYLEVAKTFDGRETIYDPSEQMNTA